MDGAFSVDGSRSGGSSASSNILSPWGYYKKVWSQFGDFSGRARRREYWWFYLLNAVVFVLLMMPFVLMVDSTAPDQALLIMVPMALYALVMIVPYLAVTVRRLHDSGRSGWWLVLFQFIFGLVPYLNIIGGLVMLVLLCTDSDPGSNEYGPNPKAEVDLRQYGEIFS